MSGGKHSSQSVLDMSPTRHTAIELHLAGSAATAEDLQLVELLRSGNEAAFISLVDRYTTTMMRLAMIYVTDWTVAEEVVQETWMAVLEGLGRFEGRSSLKTWMFRILTNRAKTRAQREGRSIPFSSLIEDDSDAAGLALSPDRFLPADHRWSGHWVSFPSNWEEMPEERLLAQETAECVKRAVEALPPVQREIITLRDIEGWTSEEACNVLGISEGNQRVLLHRGRSKVRSILEKYFEEEEDGHVHGRAFELPGGCGAGDRVSRERSASGDAEATRGACGRVSGLRTLSQTGTTHRQHAAPAIAGDHFSCGQAGTRENFPAMEREGR